MNLSSLEVLKNRHYTFLIALVLSFINPVTILWMGTTWTFTFAILFTFLIWFYIRWDDYLGMGSRGNQFEVLLGFLLILGNLARNFLNIGSPSFGNFDMLVMLIGLYLIFFGLRSTRFFLPLILYMTILILGYQVEFLLEQVRFLEYGLAQFIGSLLSLLGIRSWVSGNTVIMIDSLGETNNLVIDAPCTGIKGVLAYSSLAALLVFDLKSSSTRKVGAVLAGLIGTIIVNILRLSMIFLAVYILGLQAGLFLHAYLGYFLFTAWVLFFWSIAPKYMVSDSPKKAQASIPS